MPVKDIHKDIFDEGTLTKLDIFEAYLREWIPVFIHTNQVISVNIYDFFAGPGSDPKGVLGSPLRIIKVVEEYKDSLIKNNMKVRLIFNDFDLKKINILEKTIDNKQLDLIKKGFLRIEYYNKDFKELFYEEKDRLKNNVNLLFLDQNGVKHITDDILKKLEEFCRTDFIFFISSSYLKRFASQKEFKEYFPDLAVDRFNNIKHTDSHRFMLEYYRKKISINSKLKLYPFSIMKNKSNIYGLIFGSHHLLGVEKFLKLVWNKNKINGEANYDIDDYNNPQRELFQKKISKIKSFQNELKKYILSEKSITNKQIYDFTLEKGRLPKHTSEIIKDLKNKKKIRFSGSANISYNKCYKEKVIKKIEVI